MGLKLVGFTIIIVLLALAVPVMIDSPSEDTNQNIRLETGDTTVINDRLNIFAEDVQPNDGNSTITVTDTETLESATKTIPTGGNATYQLGSENVTVAVTAIASTSDGDFVDVAVRYSPTYGWATGPRTIVDNLALILVVMVAVMVLGFIYVGARGGRR